MKVAITRPIQEAGLKMLRDQFEVIVHDDTIMSEDELKQFAQGADALVTLITDKVTDGVMEAAGEQLKVIAQYAVGYDNVDLDAAKRRGIAVTNTPGVLSGPSVSEHALNLMFAVARHTVPADAFMRQGKYTQWDPNLYLGQQLMGCSLSSCTTSSNYSPLD
jgi:glyoxylate reductase